MNRKKFFKIITVWAVLFIFIMYILEFISYNFIYSNWEDELFHNHSINNLNFLKLEYNKDEIDGYKDAPDRFENTELTYDSRKRPILLLGCSYTYGQGIIKNKNFSSQLQNYTKRKVNNFAEMGNGLTSNLCYVEGFKNTILKNKYEYIIYTWMYNHLERVEVSVICYYLSEIAKRNKDKSFRNKLIYFADKFYFIKLIKAKKFVGKDGNRTEENIKNLYAYNKFLFIKIKELVQQEIPDAKFYILFYDDLAYDWHEGFQKDSLNTDNWNELKKYGYNIITTKELVGDILWKDEYKLKTDPFQEPHHPNEKAWELIVPALAKKLDI